MSHSSYHIYHISSYFCSGVIYAIFQSSGNTPSLRAAWIRYCTIFGIPPKASLIILLDMFLILEDLFTLKSLHTFNVSISLTIISCISMSLLTPV